MVSYKITSYYKLNYIYHLVERSSLDGQAPYSHFYIQSLMNHFFYRCNINVLGTNGKITDFYIRNSDLYNYDNFIDVLPSTPIWYAYDRVIRNSIYRLMLGEIVTNYYNTEIIYDTLEQQNRALDGTL